MAETQNEMTDVQKAEQAANEARVAQQKAQDDAQAQGKSSTDKKVDKLTTEADDKRAEAEEAKRAASSTDEPTTAGEAKSFSALTDPDRNVGDHLAQKFSHTPENPQLVPGLDPDAEGKVKLVMETSDTLAAGKPNVCYVHPEMVGDYLRAGWSRA